VTLEEWLAAGVAAGYCSPAVCETHGGVPLTEAEADRVEEGEDPCIVAVRIWHDASLLPS
jgi:hypothetical protein